MKNWGTKTDNTAGDGGEVDGEEYNSLFDELKNTVTAFGTALAVGDNNQLRKAIDIAVKASNYEDGGTANTITLTRPATGDTTETLFDGMVVYFSPKFANTGATTLKITTLSAKPLKYLGLDLTVNRLVVGTTYRVVYDLGNEWFNLEIVKLNINVLVGKTTPVDADELAIADSASSFNVKKLTWGNLKTTLTTFFDTLYSKFGIGQNWQDLTGSRSLGVTYTNTSGNTIQLSINMELGASDDYEFFIDGVSKGASNTGATTAGNTFLTHCIPNNSTYRVNIVALTPIIKKWFELK